MNLDALAVLAKQRLDALRLFRARDIQIPAYESTSTEMALFGGNRSGKSTVAATLFASIARGVPITTHDGREIETRRPWQKNTPLLLWCHDEQTEVLTRSGWKLFENVSDDDELGTVNLTTDTLEFQKPLRLHAGRYDGDMVRFSGSMKLDMLVTPEHRMVVYPDRQAPDYVNEDTPVFRLAGDVRVKDRLKASVSNWVGESPVLPEFLGDVSPEAFAEWLGFYIAEGCCSNTDNGSGYSHWKVVITQKKPAGVEYFLDIASRVPFKFFRVPESGAFVTCSKKLWQYLHPLGNCYTKHVPEWVKNAPQSVIRKFLDGYIAGDGHIDKNGSVFCSSVSRRLADDIQELYLKVGLNSSLNIRPPGVYEFKSEGRSGERCESYHVSAWRTGKAGLRYHGGHGVSKKLYSTERYSGNVYCATVPNGTLVTRRNGRPIISGNCIGYQVNHSDTIHRLLCRPGLFKIIKDQQTGAWRAFDPDKDAGRWAESKPSPPLIPPSEIEVIGWVRKSSNEWDTIKLKNGTLIKFYPSTGHEKEGDPVDVIWIDEKIHNSDHYPEFQARLSDKKGRMFWSSKPNIRTSALLQIRQRAEEQLQQVRDGERAKVDVECFVYSFSGNPFIDAEEKRKRIEGWSEKERRARDLGEFVLDEVLIYPTFDPDVHCAYNRQRELDDKLAEVLRERGGNPPEDWTRELILDPGTSHPAILFGAIPPQRYWANIETPYFVVYDEIYERQKTADDLARIVRDRCGGLKFQRFIIDGRAARQKPMSFDVSISSNYSRAFAAHNLFCVETKQFFTPGSSDFTSRSHAVHRWMQIQGNGRPQLRVVTHKCPGLVRQLQVSMKSCNGDEVLDRPLGGQAIDCLTCLEYWASRNPRYVPPPPRRRPEDEYVDEFDKWVQRMVNRGQQQSGTVTLGLDLESVA